MRIISQHLTIEEDKKSLDALLLNRAKKLTKDNQEELTRPLLLSCHEIPHGVEINESYMHENSTVYEKGFYEDKPAKITFGGLQISPIYLLFTRQKSNLQSHLPWITESHSLCVLFIIPSIHLNRMEFLSQKTS